MKTTGASKISDHPNNLGFFFQALELGKKKTTIKQRNTMFSLLNIQYFALFLHHYLNLSKFMILTMLTPLYKRSDFLLIPSVEACIQMTLWWIVQIYGIHASSSIIKVQMGMCQILRNSEIPVNISKSRLFTHVPGNVWNDKFLN